MSKELKEQLKKRIDKHFKNYRLIHLINITSFVIFIAILILYGIIETFKLTDYYMLYLPMLVLGIISFITIIITWIYLYKTDKKLNRHLGYLEYLSKI